MLGVGGFVLALISQNACAQVIGQPVSHGNSLYYLVGPTTWTDAENQALALGGHLATVNDAAEDTWIFTTFSPRCNGWMWIGLRRAVPHGPFTWVSGAAVGYTNWDAPEPNDYPYGPDGEQYAHYFGTNDPRAGRWNDFPNTGDPFHITLYGVVEVPCTIMNPPEWHWVGDVEFKPPTHSGNWGSGMNWTPQGAPANNGVAVFDLPLFYHLDLEADHRIGAISVTAGYPNLHFNGFTLDRPMGCTLLTSLAVWPPAGGIAQLNLSVGQNGEGGRFNTSRAVFVALEPNSTGVLEISGITLDAGEHVILGAGPGSTGILELLNSGILLAHAGILVGGRDASGMVNIGDGGVLRIGGSAKLGGLASGTGTLNIGNGVLVNSLGAVSQLLVGAEPADEGGLTVGLLNLHTGGVLDVTEVSLGAAERSRGSFTMDGGLMDVQSLIIGNRSIGQFDWSGGTITGLENITIGKFAGSDGRLDLDGPAQSLTFASAGGNALIAVGQLGRGQLRIENGARVDLTAGSIGGMSIGNAVGARGFVSISGANSAVVADDASILITGNSGTSGSLADAMIVDNHGLARFGKAFIGNSPGQIDSYSGDTTIRTRGRLEVTLAADSIGGSDGLIVGNSNRSAALKVESGGTVECTSGWAYNTNGLSPVIHVTGIDDEQFPALPSSLTCSGNFYIAGQFSTGATMRVDNGAVMNTNNLYLGWAAGTPFRGELIVEGPRQVLTNSGTLFLGVEGDPQALGRLVLENGSSVRTHRLKLGDAYSVTNGVTNNPRLLIGNVRGVADIQCDTLLFGPTSDLAAFDISIGPGAGIGGHGTWSQGFDNTSGGEVVVLDARIASEPQQPVTFTIEGNFTQNASGRLEVACGTAYSYQNESTFPINSWLTVQGSAAIDGTLRLNAWTLSEAGPNFFVRNNDMIGRTYEVLTADSVMGQFDTVDFGPDFPTNRVQLTYEPTRVLVTILPPVCDPSIQAQPIDDLTCPGGSATFNIAATGSPDGFGGPATYQWQHFVYEEPSYEWYNISEGGNGAPYSGLPIYSAVGTNTSMLTLTVDAAYLNHAYEPGLPVPIRCIVTNACSSIISSQATLRVCRADFTCDGFVNSQDFFNFLTAFFSSAPAADFNYDTFINSQDFFDFLAAFFAGC